MNTKMLMFHVPDDQELVAAFGEVALRHEHLNHILKMTIKTLANLSPQEAIDATIYDGSRKLRDRIRKLAMQKLGEGEPLLKLQALMGRCERVTDKRNKLVHGLWAQELDGDAQVRNAGESRPLPSTNELQELSNEIRELTNKLNFERLEGFLKVALTERKAI